MFKKPIPPQIALFTALIVSVGTVAAQPQNFVAHLSGGEEVSSVDTKATGQVKLQLDKSGTELAYKLIVANIVDVKQAHIHCGPAGDN